MKNFICQRILALTLAFIILSCESPAGIDSRDSSEPGTTTLDFNSDGPGYAAFPTGGDLSTPSVSGNSTLLAAKDAKTIATAVAGAFASACFGVTMWQSNNYVNGVAASANWYWLIAVGMIAQAVTMFLPAKVSETDRKLAAMTNQIIQIKKELQSLQDELQTGVVEIQDALSKADLGNYINDLQAAALSAQYLNDNGINLTRARNVFTAVDGGITTGQLGALNSNEMLADACRNLFCSDIPALGVTAKTGLYDSYITLAHLITGETNAWTGGGSAIATYSMYLSKVYNYNTQTFKKRQEFINAIRDTFETLSQYLLKAITFDLEFNEKLYEETKELTETLTDPDELATAERLVANTLGNVNYVRDKLLDVGCKEKGSITYLVDKVGESLMEGQIALQKEEAIVKLLPITGEKLNSEGVTRYTDTVAELYGKYDPLIYAYRLGRYLKKDLIEVPAEQYVRYNMGTDYQIADWETSRFRDVASLESVLNNYKLSGKDMRILKDNAYYRNTNIIDDLSAAGFSFNISLKNSGNFGQNAFYILGMGDSEETSSSGPPRKIFENVIVWRAYAPGPRLDATWTPDGVGDVVFSKDLIWKILAINYYSKKKSTTAYSAHGDAPTPDPCILIYGDEKALPSQLRDDN